MLIAYRRLAELRERGDTIVEVLIAIAVISLVLAGAYVTTNHSLLGTRDAQERGTAVKLVESQIEQLKGAVATNPDSVFVSAPSSFCFSNVGTVQLSSSNPCNVNDADVHTGIEPIYHLAIKLTVNGSFNTFTVTNTWSSITGNVTNNVQMEYRLYR